MNIAAQDVAMDGVLSPTQVVEWLLFFNPAF